MRRRRVRYARFISYLREEEKLAIASPAFTSVIHEHDSWAASSSNWEEYGPTDPANRLMAVDTRSYLPGDLNAKVDITTMSVSLEARSPFLDHHFFGMGSENLGDRKIRDGSPSTSPCTEGWLDDDLIHRTKMVSGVPLADWLRGPLKDLVHDALTDQTARQRDLFDPASVRRLVGEHMSGQDPGFARVYAHC